MSIKRDQRIQIASGSRRAAGEQQHRQQEQRQPQPVKWKQRDEHEHEHARQLDRIAQLKAWLGEVGQGHKRHIEEDLRVEPACLHRKIAQDERPDDAERAAQRTGRIEAGQLDGIDTDLQKDQLPEHAQVRAALDQRKARV